MDLFYFAMSLSVIYAIQLLILIYLIDVKYLFSRRSTTMYRWLAFIWIIPFAPLALFTLITTVNKVSSWLKKAKRRAENEVKLPDSL